MKKAFLTILWTAVLLAMSAVTAFADVAFEPEPVLSDGRPLTLLIVSLAVLAGAVIVWLLVRRRK